MNVSTLFKLLLATTSLRVCFCWSQEELDLFDLVEEIPENFYSVLQVDKSASAGEIRRSYRQLSLQLHPDKSDDPEAAEKFRKLVAVAEVLRDEERRASYDIILRDGLPDWKQPLYYYRRVRKMGLLELCVFLLVILTVAQYIFGWAVYVEKLLVLQEVVSRKQKKDERKSSRKSKSGSHSLEAELEYCTQQADASIPRLKNLLPVLLAKKFLSLIRTFWKIYCQWRGSNTHPSQPTNEECSLLNHTDQNSSTSQTGSSDRFKGREKQNHLKVQKSTVHQSSSGTYTSTATDDSQSKQRLEEHGSSDDSDRSESTNRHASGASKCCVSNKEESGTGSTSVSETVDQKSRNEKFNAKHSYPLSQETSSDGLQQNGLHDDSPSLPTLAVTSWSQYQQVQLEWALTAYPKFSTDRWENIAKGVPGKTKEECVQRCMELFEAVKRRKGNAVNKTVNDF